ncbi:MAG: site-2 protease family protein [Candidatus Aenigmarchaeota archaeon]|nr:site-2 protease family protein [Candidatus Aenigmarchaeota archaeon]
MDLYLVSVIIFVILLALLVYKDRKSFQRESIFLLRRSKRGRGFLTKIGTTCPGGWKVVGFVSVITGFIVSVLGLKMLFDNLVAAIQAGASAPSLALLLPSPTAEPIFGYGYLAVPFWYWIICLALLALVHEGFHGIFTAREKVRIKSLGFGILAVIPLAFVEPDEKALEKKGMWPALRVFSAGSFANFLLAIVSVIIFVGMITSIYSASGVNFQTYPFAKVQLSDIGTIGGNAVYGEDGIISILENYGENDTLQLTAGNDTYFIKKKYLEEQLGEGEIILFKDYPAARAGIEGTIVKVNDDEIMDLADLSFALEKAGVNTDIEVTVLNEDGTEDTVFMHTSDMPESGPFVPDGYIGFFASMEQVLPGSIDFYIATSESVAAITGQEVAVTWNYANQRILMWEWVADNYPSLSGRADANIAQWQAELAKHNKPGFIGVLNVAASYELNDGLEPLDGVFGFIQGLLMFLFIINIGVGIVNLLPVKPLDGGKMWDILMARYIPKHSKQIMRILGYVVLALLLANFIPFGAFL